jgi:hypothetical protein
MLSSSVPCVQMQSHRQSGSGRRRLVLLAIAFAAVSLASIFTFGPTAYPLEHNNSSSESSRKLQTLGMYIDPKSVDIKQLSAEEHDSYENIVTADSINNNPTTNTNNNNNPSITTYTDLVHNEIALPQYTLQQVIEATDTMRSKYAILRYDPTTDKFTGYYSKNQRWVPGCYKLMHSISALSVLLRAIFPERFTRNSSPEFIMGVSSGDYPAMMDQGCIYRDQDGPCDESGSLKAPVLHFGSVYRKPMFPNMIGECLFHFYILSCATLAQVPHLFQSLLFTNAYK